MGIVEIRFHGRGGQGAVTAASLLAGAAVLEGKWGQAIPSFGAERRGAPVVAYARISEKPLKRHSGIYQPDIVVVLDPELPEAIDVTDGLKENGIIIVNSPVKPDKIAKNRFRIFYVDANNIARKLGLIVAGWPVVNTSMLGALAKVTKVVGIGSIKKQIISYFGEKIGEVNAMAAQQAYDQVCDP